MKTMKTMKTMKRLICIVLSLLMVFSVAACDNKGTESKVSSEQVDNATSVVDTSSDEASSEETTSTESVEATSSTPSKDSTPSKVTSVIFYQPGVEDNSGSNQVKMTSLTWKQVKAKIPAGSSGKTIELMNWNTMVPGQKVAIDRFTKETGIKVTYTQEDYFTYLTKIASRVATGNPPTVVRLRDNIPKYMLSMQPINNTGYDFNDTYWDQDILLEYNVNGLLYAVNLESSPYYQPMLTFYNQELIDKYGLEDPYELWKDGEWTWEKMLEICEVFVEAAGEGYQGLSTLFGEYVFSTGTAYYTYKDNKYTANLKTEKFAKAIQYMNKAYQDGYIDGKIGDLEGFNNGKVLFMNESEIAGRNSHFMIQDINRSGKSRAVPIPAVDGQKEYYVPISENEAYGVPNKASDIELVPYFLRFYLDTANYDMKTFYAHSSMLEAVEWTRSQKRTPVLMELAETQSCIGSLLKCTPSQIVTNIDQTWGPAAKTGVSDATSKLKDLVK